MSTNFSFEVDSTVEGNIAKESTKFLNRSGLFPVRILKAVIEEPKEGSKGLSIGLYVDHNGEEQMLYNAIRIKNNNGDDNAFGRTILNNLYNIANVKGTVGASSETVTLPTGKGKTEVSYRFLPHLTDLSVILHVQMSYDESKDGGIYESKNIRNVFRADKASADEIIAKLENSAFDAMGKQYEKVEPTAADDLLGKNVTKEMVEAHKESRRSSGKKAANANSAPDFDSAKPEEVPF